MARPTPTNLLFDREEVDRALTEEEERLVSRLTVDDLTAIDEALLERAGPQWRKVAALVSNALRKMERHLPMLPDVYYGRRVRQMVETDVLESQGDLARMRFGEVRLRASPPRSPDE
jgi:hypothetical protein